MDVRLGQRTYRVTSTLPVEVLVGSRAMAAFDISTHPGKGFALFENEKVPFMHRQHDEDESSTNAIICFSRTLLVPARSEVICQARIGRGVKSDRNVSELALTECFFSPVTNSKQQLK